MNFLKLWENMQSDKGDQAEIDPMALTVIRTGLSLDESFWENFMQMLNNSEGLSALLDIPIEKITTWRKKVEDAIDRVADEDGEVQVKKNKKLIKNDMPEDDNDEESGES